MNVEYSVFDKASINIIDTIMQSAFFTFYVRTFLSILYSSRQHRHWQNSIHVYGCISLINYPSVIWYLECFELKIMLL